MNDLTPEETRYIIQLLSERVTAMDGKIAYYQGHVWSEEFKDMCYRRQAVRSIIRKLKNQVAIESFDRN